MHQSPQKTRQRDRQVEFDANEEQGGRQPYRAVLPRARKFHLREEAPRAQREERRQR